MQERAAPPDSITFLGTAGARIMVANQLLASGGMWFNLGGTEILVDPGPGCIVQSTKRKLRAEKLSAIILSHRHLDHSADTNIMVEAMTQGGFKPRGWFYAPADAFGPDPVLWAYQKGFLEGVVVLREGDSYNVGGVTLSTPVRHKHPAETYGLVFRAGNYTVSCITDTLYFDGLLANYGGDLIILNVVFTERRPGVEHLALPDAERIIGALKPKAAILSHFGTSMWRAHPWELAEELSQKTGVRVIAARDGMRFHLAELDQPKEKP